MCDIFEIVDPAALETNCAVIATSFCRRMWLQFITGSLHRPHFSHPLARDLDRNTELLGCEVAASQRIGAAVLLADSQL